MASAFDHSGIDFVPKISNQQWDAGKQAIEDHKDDFERAIIAAGLAAMASDPKFAPFVPILVSKLKIKPNSEPNSVASTIAAAFRSADKPTPVCPLGD